MSPRVLVIDTGSTPQSSRQKPKQLATQCHRDRERRIHATDAKDKDEQDDREYPKSG
jgi:hypothetical protein